MSEVTRVEVITDHGREFVLYDLTSVELSYQDNGRTLKIFVSSEIGDKE